MNIFREKLVYRLNDLKVWVLIQVNFFYSVSVSPTPSLSLLSFSSPLPYFPPFIPPGCWQEDAFSAVPRYAITFFACRYFVISSAFCHAVTL